MLFNSGTPSLITETTKYAIGASTNPSDIHSTNEIKAAINDAYRQLREIARVHGEGQEFKRSYTNGVVNQLWYSLPDGFKRIISVEVERAGRDISSDSAADPQFMEKVPIDVLLEYNSDGEYSDTRFVGIGDQHFALAIPLAVGGTNSIRLSYEAQTANLTNDTDEPTVPAVFHSLICKMAALMLRTSVDHPINDLQRLVVFQLSHFKTWAQDRMDDPEDQIAVAGLTDQPTSILQGSFYRRA